MRKIDLIHFISQRLNWWKHWYQIWTTYAYLISYEVRMRKCSKWPLRILKIRILIQHGTCEWIQSIIVDRFLFNQILLNVISSIYSCKQHSIIRQVPMFILPIELIFDAPDVTFFFFCLIFFLENVSYRYSFLVNVYVLRAEISLHNLCGLDRTHYVLRYNWRLLY